MKKSIELARYKHLSIGLGVAVAILSVAVLFLWTNQAEAPESDFNSDTDSVSDSQESAAGSRRYAESFVGLNESDAAAKAEQDGYSYRIVARDGEFFPVTMDYNPKRVNLTIENGVVTRATLG